MNGQLIWFLLRHEFRLRQRDRKTNLRNQIIDSLSIYLFLGTLFFLLIVILLRPPHPHEIRFHLFSNPLPDIFPVIAGVSIVIYLITGTDARRRINPRILGNESLEQNLYDTPISSHILLVSHLLNNIVRDAFSGNIYLFPFWIGLSVFYGKPEFIISLPLTTIFIIACQESLSLWKKYIFYRWLQGEVAKFLINCSIFIFFVAIFIFVFLIKVLSAAHILSDKLIQHWFDSIYWLWLPGRATLLDPLPTIGFLLTSIGLVWVTIETLHRPLLRVLQTPIIESRHHRTHYKTVKFKSNLIYILIQREWRYLRVSLLARFIQSIFMCFYPCLILSMPFAYTNALSLIMAMSTSLWLSIFAWLQISIIFAVEDSLQLLASSPIKLRTVGWCKRLALLIPFWFSCLPIILLALIKVKFWGWIIFFILVSPLCQVILRSWNIDHSLSLCFSSNLPHQGKENILSCRDQKILVWLEFLSFGILVFCSYCMFVGQTVWGCLALVLEVCLIALAYRRNLQLGDIWGI